MKLLSIHNLMPIGNYVYLILIQRSKCWFISLKQCLGTFWPRKTISPWQWLLRESVASTRDLGSPHRQASWSAPFAPLQLECPPPFLFHILGHRRKRATSHSCYGLNRPPHSLCPLSVGSCASTPVCHWPASFSSFLLLVRLWLQSFMFLCWVHRLSFLLWFPACMATMSGCIWKALSLEQKSAADKLRFPPKLQLHYVGSVTGLGKCASAAADRQTTTRSPLKIPPPRRTCSKPWRFSLHPGRWH